MSAIEKLKFHWNDHVQHLSKILTAQREEETFCDITLISDDEYVLKAHQAVLVCTSGFFQRVLSWVGPAEHPTVVLYGIPFKELSCILEYIYQGITQVDQSMMNSILEAADSLEIKGLSKIKGNCSVKRLFSPLPSLSPTPISTPMAQAPKPSDSSFLSCGNSSNSILTLNHSPSDMDSSSDKQNVTDATSKSALSLPCNSASTDATLFAYSGDDQTSEQSFTKCNDQTTGIDLSLSKTDCNINKEMVMLEAVLAQDFSSRYNNKRKERADSDAVSSVTTSDSYDWTRISEKFDDCLRSKKRSTSSSPGEKSDDCGCNSESVIKTNSHLMEPDPIFTSPQSSPRYYQFSPRHFTIETDVHTSERSTAQDAKSEFIASSVYGAIDTKYSDTESSTICATNCEASGSKENNKIVATPIEAINIQSKSSNRLNTEVGDSISGPKQITNTANTTGSNGNSILITNTAKNIGTANAEDPMANNNISELILNTVEDTGSALYGTRMTCTTTTNANVNTSLAGSQQGTSSASCSTIQPCTHFQPEKNILEGINLMVTSPVSSNTTFPSKGKLRKPQTQIKRPMNQYYIFMSELRRQVQQEHPELNPKEVSKLLSKMWKELNAEEKKVYKEKADQLKREHKQKYPNYFYDPNERQAINLQYKKEKIFRKNLYRVV